MSALKKLRRWLQSRIRPPEPDPDRRDLLIPPAIFPPIDFNQGEFHNDVERQLTIARREARQQQHWRSRAGPWQQK